MKKEKEKECNSEERGDVRGTEMWTGKGDEREERTEGRKTQNIGCPPRHTHPLPR